MSAPAGRGGGGMRRLLLLLLLFADGCAAPLVAGDSGAGHAAGFYRGLSPGERHLARATVQLALEKRISGAPETWTNTATGNSGTVTPLRTFRTSRSFFCRDYREAVRIGAGAAVERRRTACRDRDGIWKLPRL